MCLEHGESSRIAAEVFEAGPGLVLDLAADFRVQDPDLYARYYGAHPSPHLLERFAPAPRLQIEAVREDDVRGDAHAHGRELFVRDDLFEVPTHQDVGAVRQRWSHERCDHVEFPRGLR